MGILKKAKCRVQLPILLNGFIHWLIPHGADYGEAATTTPTHTMTPGSKKVYLPLIIKAPSGAQSAYGLDGFQSWFQGLLARWFHPPQLLRLYTHLQGN